ncbi:MAG: ATP synthase F1 subunit epsilon [Saprospiraceae bacterium]|jgi:F-type H+-transporting ATPase subunit epsilon|nr:ATP synthase F1 subunit epsilon [Saprospiraceae bacterium]
MKVTILTPVSQLFEGEAKSIKAPGISGGLEILDRHAPIISALGKGTVSITDLQGQKHKFEIKKGFLEVLQNEVSILVRV